MPGADAVREAAKEGSFHGPANVSSTVPAPLGHPVTGHLALGSANMHHSHRRQDCPHPSDGVPLTLRSRGQRCLRTIEPVVRMAVTAPAVKVDPP
ncbi:hypothetical protein GCM10023225_01340 [Kineococcus glutinatus]|uniref:Uncharacterized protein n=1 Tax=Kineococcus glutinatus TaxID=1070872 RepID=A0ABP9H4L9_9ACTN